MTGSIARASGQGRVISPPPEALAALSPTLTGAEARVLDFLDRHLTAGWEIYVQPHLNGLRPDFVILHPDQGIGVIEVTDWNLDSLDIEVTQRSAVTRELKARTPGGEVFTPENPFTKVRRYKEDIFNLYCPRLQDRVGFGAINAIVATPFSRTQHVAALQDAFISADDRDQRAEFWPILGRDQIESGDIWTAVPLLRRQGRSLMRPELAADLRGWLTEPDLSRDQRAPLDLDPDQARLATERTASGFRRIRGAAGSGKSQVLAARAARLLDEGKNVLVVTYNMTLWHYLRDLVLRARQTGDRFTGRGNGRRLELTRRIGGVAPAPGRITFTHFHHWCKWLCLSPGLVDRHAAIMAPVARIRDLGLSPEEEERRLRPILPPILNDALPRLAIDALRAGAGERFDAILVDEGQDFLPLWWQALRGALAPGGEMMLVADHSQDLYGTAGAWTDAAMRGAGFAGPWSELWVSYRLPPDLLAMARAFAERLLPGATRILPEPPQGELALYPCSLRWVQCDEQEAVSACCNAILKMMQDAGPEAGLAHADICFLAGSRLVGEEVVERLAAEPWGLRYAHTFSPGKRTSDRQKMAFFLGRPQLKATTLQSFKGWETRMLVVHLTTTMTAQDRAAAYAALTRLKRHVGGSFMTVVCTALDLAAFGRTWPAFNDRSTPLSAAG